MKKPFGQRDGPTEPLSQDAADTEDGPTLRVYVPEHGNASHLPSFDLPPESLTQPRWAPALPSFDETTSSGFYETMTRQRGDLYEDAATLEKRPEPDLPRFPTGGGAWQPAPSRPAWSYAAPDRPLPSAPLPLLPPRSAPFPLVPRAPSAAPPPFRMPVPPRSALPTPSRPRPSRPPPAPSRPIPSRPPPAPSRPIPSRPPPAPSRPLPSHPPPAPSRPAPLASRPKAAASAPQQPPPDDDPIIEIAPELAVGDGDAFHDEQAFPTDVDLSPPFSEVAAAPLPSTPPPRAPMTTLPGVRGRPPSVAHASGGKALRHPLLALRPRLRVTSDKTALSVAIGVFTALAVAGVLSAIVFVSTRDDAPPSSGTNEPATAGASQPPETTTTGAPRAALTPSPAEPGASPASCELSQPPRKLAVAILPAVPPMVSSAPGERHVAVGFAAAAYQATGLIVNVEDLSAEVRLSEQTSRPVFRVTPLPHRSPVTFAVDHDDPRVAGLRTVPARAPFQLGLARDDLVRIDPGREPSVIWPGGGSGGIGEPQFASIDGKGHAVAMRRGRGAGEIVFGWLAQSGARDTDLARIDLGPREVGTPTIATSDDTALVVSAARGLGERWHLYGALAGVGKAAGPARRIEPSDTGGNEIAPLVVAHPRGGWLLRWLEGQPGAWRVRSRVLDASLAPQGAIIELAGPDGVSDAPGALIVRKGRVLALHQQSAGRANELWGSALRCP